MSQYEVFTEVTKEILDSVQVGDLIKVNEWKQPLRVRGVSENYFVMSRAAFGNVLYAVCEKKPWGGIRYNAMRGGMFHVGTDNWVFGYFDGYDFTNNAKVRKYLSDFESGECELSCRRSVPIYSILIKRKGEDNAR